MCDVCGCYFGHLAGCPEEPEIIVGKCAKCGDPIYEGNEKITINEEEYCECLLDYSARELIELFGGKIEIARR